MGTMESDWEGLAPSRIEADREAWMEREIADERDSRLATPGEAHAEWHLNTGIPMGTPGCPQDACHLPDDFAPEPEAGEGIRCAHCKARHWDVAEVKACAALTRPTAIEAAVKAERAADSQWSWDYQKRWGRAENE